jgi:hypothetical protein
MLVHVPELIEIGKAKVGERLLKLTSNGIVRYLFLFLNFLLCGLDGFGTAINYWFFLKDRSQQLCSSSLCYCNLRRSFLLFNLTHCLFLNCVCIWLR